MRKFLAAALLTSAVIATPAFAATTLNLNGASVTGTLLFPDSTVYAGPATRTVGTGVEFTSGTFSPAPQSIDIGRRTISLFTNAAATYSSNAAFNGFRLDFSNYTGALGLLRVASSSTFQPVGFSVQGDSVFINLVGQTVGANDRIDINAVPEPATWGMMILGFGAIGAAMRRRKSAVRTTVRFA